MIARPPDTLLELLRTHQVVVISGQTGCGKTAGPLPVPRPRGPVAYVTRRYGIIVPVPPAVMP